MESAFIRKLLAVIATGAILIGLVAYSVEGASPINNLTHLDPDCELIGTFTDGRTVYICPPDVTETSTATATDTETSTATPSNTPTLTPTVTATPTVSGKATKSPTPGSTATPVLSTATPSVTPTSGGVGIAPFPNAPLCPNATVDHDTSVFHTLWDAERGCHWTHEHGENPFTQQVANTFPGFDLRSLMGGVGIGHTNLSSPMENSHKHAGFKWQVQPSTPQGCRLEFEDATTGVDAVVIQYHAFGDYSIEFEARVHTALALARQCMPGSTNYGYIFTIQFQDYGQRLFAYQGQNMPYPDAPPPYDTPLGPYFTNQCIFCGAKNDTRQAILDDNSNTPTTWTSKGGRVVQQELFNLLFRARDLFQVVDSRDQTYPFTYLWMCSDDEGLTYDAQAGCRYNNSTTRVHEIKFIIPNEWDNLAGFDTDSRIGRITADGFTDVMGNLNASCEQAGAGCFPIKLVRAYVGHTGAEIQADKIDQFNEIGLPERDIYFCNGVVCTETSPNSVSSGWIGQEN